MCLRAYRRSYYYAHLTEEAAARKARRRTSDSVERHSLTAERYDQILAAQGGRCAICGTDSPAPLQRFAIDHDHACCPTDRYKRKTCGRCVRGLLCDGCNQGLGRFGDDPGRLMAAAQYLLRVRQSG